MSVRGRASSLDGSRRSGHVAHAALRMSAVGCAAGKFGHQRGVVVVGVCEGTGVDGAGVVGAGVGRRVGVAVVGDAVGVTNGRMASKAAWPRTW